MADPLIAIGRISASAIAAGEIQARVQAENIANAKTAGYIPNSVSFTQVFNKEHGVKVVNANAPSKLPDKIKQVYDPSHPMADEDGMVTYPDVDPLVTMIEMQETMRAGALHLKVGEMAQDLLYRKIRLISGKN